MSATFIEYLSVFSVLLPIAIFLIFLPKLRNEKSLWAIFIYLLLSFLSDMLIITGVTPEAFTLLQISVFTILEFTLFSFYLFEIPNVKAKMPKYLWRIISITYILISIFQIVDGLKYKTNKYYPNIATIENITIIVLCIIVLYIELNAAQNDYIYTYLKFWIVAGMLFYLAGTFFLSLVLDKLSAQETSEYWQINLVFNILKNIFFAIAFFMKTETTSNTPMRKPYSIR